MENFRIIFKRFTFVGKNPSSETQWQLVGWKGFSWANVLPQKCSKLSPPKMPSTRLAAPGSSRMGNVGQQTAHFTSRGAGISLMKKW